MPTQENFERNFGFLIADVGRLLKTEYDRRVSHTGLTRSQWWVLNQLYRRDGVTQSELADLLEIERAPLGRLLDRLEANDWIRREEDPADRRAKRVYLTEEVAPKIAELRELAAGVRRDAARGLSADQVTTLIDMLQLIKSNVQQHLDQAPGNADTGVDPDIDESESVDAPPVRRAAAGR